MRREYLIDGYNLIRSRPEGQRRRGPGNLQRERQALLGWIGARLEDEAQATVVFDASSPAAQLAPRASAVQFGVRVLFARDHDTADELIQELCKAHSHPKQLVVVSNDRQVQKTAKRRRAVTMSCDAFMARLAKNARLQRLPPPQPEKPTSPTAEERAELREIFEPLDEPPQRLRNPDDMWDFYDDMLR